MRKNGAITVKKRLNLRGKVSENEDKLLNMEFWKFDAKAQYEQHKDSLLVYGGPRKVRETTSYRNLTGKNILLICIYS